MNKQSGFTLVEIMIVVAIIALLAAIAVPNFLRARVRSQATAVKNDIRLVESAADQYAIEKGLSGSASIAFESITGYFKTGSKLANGQTAIQNLAITQAIDFPVTVGSKLSYTNGLNSTELDAAFDTTIVPSTFWDE